MPAARSKAGQVRAGPVPRQMLDTMRRVATPEGIEITLSVAGPIPRALAWGIDLGLRIAVIYALALGVAQLGKVGLGVILIVWFLLEWLAPALFETYWGGATPGKRMLGLVVLHNDGTPVRWNAAITRNLLRAVDFLPVFYGFGLASMLLNRDFKRLGDIAAGTVVIHRERVMSGVKIPTAAPVAPPTVLTLAEQRVVLDFAERSAALTTERGGELAELVPQLVGGLQGPAARERLLGIANFLSGQEP
jgi:uncharacterized RDD family membrane protein YckC